MAWYLQVFPKIKTMKKLFSILVVVFFAFSANAQTEEKDNISKAIQEGNAKNLSEYFAPMVDLTVKDIEDVYSKEQAEVIITRFFSENKSVSYSVKHEGKSKLDDYFYIGDLKSESGIYRLTFFLKRESDRFKIKQLKIESEE